MDADKPSAALPQPKQMEQEITEVTEKGNRSVHANAESASSTVMKDYENERFFNRYLSIVNCH